MRMLAVWLVLWYLRFWARVALLVHRPHLIGIAGSAGKSSAKEAIYAIATTTHRVAYTYGNSETGVPLGILGLDAGNASPATWLKLLAVAPFRIGNLRELDYLIVEMGTDEPTPPKNMDYLLTIVQPDTAVHLNALPIHTQQFSAVLTDNERQTLNLDQQLDRIVHAIAHEDGKIITQSGCTTGIYAADDPFVVANLLSFAAAQPTTRLLSFGTGAHNALQLTHYTVTPEHTIFTYLLNYPTANSTPHPVSITIPGYLLPQTYHQTIAAALLTAISLGIQPDQAAAALANNFHLPKSRSTVLPGINSSFLIDSTYNAATAATVAMVQLLATLKTQTSRPAVLLFGDMRELGDQAEAEHRKVATAIVGNVDYLYLVGPLTQQYILPAVQGANLREVRWFATSVEAGNYLKEHLPANAIVLAKGSQNTIYLEEAVKQLLANPQDAAKLCRQEDYWLKRKSTAFNKTDHKPGPSK